MHSLHPHSTSNATSHHGKELHPSLKLGNSSTAPPLLGLSPRINSIADIGHNLGRVG